MLRSLFYSDTFRQGSDKGLGNPTILGYSFNLDGLYYYKRVFSALKQTKFGNIKDAQSLKLFYLNHGVKHDPNKIFYDIKQVPQLPNQRQMDTERRLNNNKSTANAIMLGVSP